MALKQKDLGFLKGRLLAGREISESQAISLFEYISELEELLDSADSDDYFGTEGWRKYIGLPSN